MNTKYDIFISFKATAKGVVTDDVAVATDLYQSLTACGFRVFFSSQTVFKGGSSDFSKQIDNALDTARLLIVVSSKLEYISSRWVEYEWKTFNADILSNVKTDAQILTFTSGIDTRQLPRILRYVQNFDYTQKETMLSFIQAFFNQGVAAPALSAKPASESRPNDHNLYDSSRSGEIELLRVRARRSYAMDKQAIEYAKSRLEGKKYNVLVLGCAYGFVAETRFGLDDDIENVICIDKNPEVIQQAKQLYRNYPHMKFYQADVLSGDYVCGVQKILEELGIDGVDMVFIAELFRYLNAPQLALRSTRKLLRPGGMLIVRGCDDANKMAYPDEDGLLEKIVSASGKIHGMPNYHVSRELPMLIANAGLSICDILVDIYTTVNLSYEEKEEFFLSTFGSRKSIANQIMEKETVQKAALKQLCDCIDQLESIFYNTEFWYSESNLTFIARKPETR